VAGLKNKGEPQKCLLGKIMSEEGFEGKEGTSSEKAEGIESKKTQIVFGDAGNGWIDEKGRIKSITGGEVRMRGFPSAPEREMMEEEKRGDALLRQGGFHGSARKRGRDTAFGLPGVEKKWNSVKGNELREKGGRPAKPEGTGEEWGPVPHARSKSRGLAGKEGKKQGESS